MSNTVITNYTDLNGPTTKADSCVVVVVNKDGSLSVDKTALGTLMSNDRSQGAGISVVRIGHDGPPDDATDSENDDDIPHITLSVDSYYDDPNTVIKYDSGADMFHSLRIETREISLVGFQNDHCYTALASPGLTAIRSGAYSALDEPILEIKAPQPSQDVPSSKKITILEQKILPQGRKISINPSEAVLLKGNDIINKPLVGLKHKTKHQVKEEGSDENVETSSSVSSSGDSVDRDSDSDYKGRDKLNVMKFKKSKVKPRILKSVLSKAAGRLKVDPRGKIIKSNRNVVRKEIKEKLLIKGAQDVKKVQKSSAISEYGSPITNISNEPKKETPKQTPKLIKKEKKTPSHVTALLSDMTTLFSTPDVIRRVSSDAKTPTSIRKSTEGVKSLDQDEKTSMPDRSKGAAPKMYSRVLHKDKSEKPIDPMPQIDDVSLAQILQDPPGIMATSKTQPVTSTALIKDFPTTTAVSSTALAGPLSPTLDLLGGLQPEEEGLTEDLLMHVAQLVESSDNLKEVIDKQVLGKVDSIAPKPTVSAPPGSFVSTSSSKTVPSKQVVARKDPIEIVRRDGRVITLPPIEAPATRASKRKSAMSTNPEMSPGPSYHTTQLPSTAASPTTIHDTESPDPRHLSVSKHSSKKTSKTQDLMLNPDNLPSHDTSELPLETDSLNSEDDPNRLWCICKQPHNNRFMICCDQCEDWFHGKCVNITKAMGQQMEEQGVEWTCPNCIKKASPTSKSKSKTSLIQKKIMSSNLLLQGSATKQYSIAPKNGSSKHSCIVCKKAARACSIYCSDACILKHAQDSLGQQTPPVKIDSQPGIVDKAKLESRVIVFERKTGRCLAGPNAPTAENLKTWLQKNPTFEVVRPGTLSAIKPSIPNKKPSTPESRKIQTTLNFEKVSKKSTSLIQSPKTEKEIRTPIKEELRLQSPKTPSTTKYTSEPQPSTSSFTPKSEVKKYSKPVLNRSRSSTEKAPSSPGTPKQKDSEKKTKTSSVGSIRDNVRKALQEQLTLRLKESRENKLSNEDVKQFAEDTESELHELFNQDVGVKYKAKYRSLMFNIKDRKNLSLWQKICDKSITPKQLVRLSPEELASQELAEWRDNEAKHQLELIKKSELDLLAASKTYVLKTHKGEEVIKPKTAVEAELDPNMPVEDIVSALNDPSVMDEATPTGDDSVESEQGDDSRKSSGDRSSSSKKKRKDDSKSRKKESRGETSSRSSRSTRRSSQLKEREERSTRRSERRMRSTSRERRKTKNVDLKQKSRGQSRQRSKSRAKSKSKLRSKSRSRSRSRKRSRSKSKHRSRSISRQRRSTRNRPADTASHLSQSPKSKLRSKSQDDCNKSANENCDNDSRPKSAMTKESHPAYDPHEPMITSAFSDDELRKSREDMYDETYSSDVGFKGFNEFDSQKIAPAIIPSESKEVQRKREKLSEGESDQEPSSTVDSSAATVWTGCINMVDVARFYVAAHEVFGNGSELEEDLSTELDIVGRINPDTVWDYINKMKRTGNKDIVVLRLTAANDEEKMQYIALYSYLSSRNRLGVVKVSNTHTVKDFYILPLPAHETLPPVLALEGASLGEVRSHLLIAIIIRQRRKRSTVSKHPLPAKITRKQAVAVETPSIVSTRTSTLPLPFVGPSLSDNVRDKIAVTLANTDENEPYSPGGSSSSGDTPLLPGKTAPPQTGNLRDKMEDLNRLIEEEKQQIMLIAQADSSIAEQEEAYSPSRPMTPPLSAPLADIALPSNLQEILATIKQRESTAPTTRRQLRSFTPSQSK